MNGNPPQTKPDILNGLTDLKVGELEFWRAIEPERFASAFGHAWSPADTVRHLIKSTSPVTQALVSPRMTLRDMFGEGPGASIPYSDLVERYHAVLAAGGNAGSFAPSPSPIPTDLRASQQDLVSKCGSTLAALIAAVEPWTETELDLYRLPHPLLGKLTVREMLFFTLYHYEHHRAIVSRRLEASASPSSASPHDNR
jgi:hypothetical protein